MLHQQLLELGGTISSAELSSGPFQIDFTSIFFLCDVLYPSVNGGHNG
jgi:hypothetical protein